MPAAFPDGSAARLRWRTGRIGCLLPLLAAAALLFLAAAFDGSIVESMTQSGRRDAIVRMLAAINVGGVNLAFLALGLFMLFELGRMGLRWADRIAVIATREGLRFHGSLFRRPVAWSEVEEVRFVTEHRRFARVPSLHVRLRDGRTFAVPSVRNQEGEAERFAEAASHQARLAHSTPPRPGEAGTS